MFVALHAVVPVNSLLGIDKALVYAKVSDCCKQVALELEFALYEGSLGVPLAGDDLCEILVRSDNGEACVGSGVLAEAALVVNAYVVLNIKVLPSVLSVQISV